MAMATKKAKPRQSGRPGEPSRSAKQGYSVTERKASPNRSSRGQKAKLNAAQGNRKPAQAHLNAPPPELPATPSPPPPPPAPAKLTPETVQQQAGELLTKLLKLALDYQWLAFDDMELHREVSQPSLGYTAAILRGIIRASDRGDHAWLEEQAQRANRYLRAHRHEPVPPDAKLVSTWSVFNRPEAASHLKRFVMRKLKL